MHLDDNLLERIRNNDSSLTRLDFASQDLGNDNIKKLAEAMQDNQYITILDISYNIIDTEGAQHISTMRSLKELNIEGNYIGTEGAQHISTMRALKELNIAHNDIGHEGAWHISKMPVLKELNIEGNNIDTEGAQHIATMTALTKLNIAHNVIFKNGAGHIATMTALTKLNIAGNYIDTEGAQHISTMTALTKLNIADNYIGDEGAQHISTMRSLKELNIADNYIGHEGLEKIAHLLKNNKFLTEVFINSQHTDAINQLIQHNKEFLTAAVTKLKEDTILKTDEILTLSAHSYHAKSYGYSTEQLNDYLKLSLKNFPLVINTKTTNNVSEPKVTKLTEKALIIFKKLIFIRDFLEYNIIQYCNQKDLEALYIATYEMFYSKTRFSLDEATQFMNERDSNRHKLMTPSSLDSQNTYHISNFKKEDSSLNSLLTDRTADFGSTTFSNISPESFNQNIFLLPLSALNVLVSAANNFYDDNSIYKMKSITQYTLLPIACALAPSPDGCLIVYYRSLMLLNNAEKNIDKNSQNQALKIAENIYYELLASSEMAKLIPAIFADWAVVVRIAISGASTAINIYNLANKISGVNSLTQDNHSPKGFYNDLNFIPGSSSQISIEDS